MARAPKSNQTGDTSAADETLPDDAAPDTTVVESDLRDEAPHVEPDLPELKLTAAVGDHALELEQAGKPFSHVHAVALRLGELAGLIHAAIETAEGKAKDQLKLLADIL